MTSQNNETGIEVQVKDAYLLDRGAAQRALQGLKQRVETQAASLAAMFRRERAYHAYRMRW